MSQLERSDYLAAFGVPAFLYVESTDAIEVSTQKICTPCLVIETQNAHSFCQTGKAFWRRIVQACALNQGY
jgi:hypothetical protein